MVGGVLKSLESPILSKWILVALALSIAFNSYLFNAATAGLKDHDRPHRPIDPLELAWAQKFNDPHPTKLPLGDSIGQSFPLTHSAPAPTENEGHTATQAATSHPYDLGLPTAMRSQKQLEEILLAQRGHELADEEIVELSLRGRILSHAL
jgi:hydroxymethylglutaryl-CoA reductase (NADPH)